MRCWSFILVVLLSIQVAGGTLTAADKKKKETKPKQVKKVTDFDKQFEKDDLTYEQLTSFDSSSYSLDNVDRAFTSGAALAYVTPWNADGYKNTIKAAAKLTHVAPVWFQINEPDDEEFGCNIDGAHNIDRDWISKLRENNPDIKIVPRFLFDQWKTHSKIEKFLMDDEQAVKCGHSIVEFINRNEFDGAVVEIYVQLMMLTGGKGEEVIIEILENWGDMFKRAKKQTVIPLFPPRQADVNKAMHPDRLRKFVENADYVMLMTYDYSSQQPVGVAPLPWVDINLQYTLESIEGLDSSKILIGLNYYGYFYKNHRPEAGLIRDFVKVLKEDKSVKLFWDRKSEEHVIIHEKDGKKGIVAYLPTRRSIQARIDLISQYDVGIGIWEAGQAPLDYFEPL